MSLDTRVAALDGLLEEAGLDAVLATKDASIAYLTGFWGLQLERFFGVVVKRGGERRADRAVARSRERRHRADRPGQDALQRRRLQRPARAVRDARRRQAHRRRGGPPQLRPLEGADRGRLRARPGDRWSCTCARPRTPRRSRPSGAPAGTSRPPTTSCGRGLEIGHTEAETNARVAYLLARRGATHSEPHILFGTNAALPHGSPGRAQARGRRHRLRRHRRPVRRLLGRPDPLRARRLAERLGRQGLGGRARGLHRRRSR